MCARCYCGHRYLFSLRKCQITKRTDVRAGCVRASQLHSARGVCSAGCRRGISRSLGECYGSGSHGPRCELLARSSKNFAEPGSAETILPEILAVAFTATPASASMGTRRKIIVICDYPSEDLNQDSGSLKANTPVPIYVDQFLPDGRGSKMLICDPTALLSVQSMIPRGFGSHKRIPSSLTLPTPQFLIGTGISFVPHRCFQRHHLVRLGGRSEPTIIIPSASAEARSAPRSPQQPTPRHR